jgi:hypothetical protein
MKLALMALNLAVVAYLIVVRRTRRSDGPTSPPVSRP